MVRRSIDPVTLQVFTNALYSISDEMSAALVRTAYSTNIKDRRDCSSAVYTAQGEVVAQSEIGTPLHLGVMGPTVATVLKKISIEKMQPGDDILVNEPFPEGPGHLNDVTLISPVFFDGEVVALVANMAHHVDMGGYAPGSMPFGVSEIYQEGLQIPPVRISKGGKLDDDLIALISQNVRTGTEFRGDLLAQIAANNVGEKRLCELMGKYGKSAMLDYMREILDYSERRMVAGIKNLPNGVYTFEDYLEGDGISDDLISIRAKVEIQDSTVTVDFRETSKQVRGSVNCRPPSAQACVYYVMKCVIDPGLPPNSGAFRPIRVLTEPGSLLEVGYPAAVCNANIVTSQRIADVLFGALKKAIPDRVLAASSGTMNLLSIGGVDPRGGRLFNYIETCGGGQGAMHDRDGMSGVQMHMTNTRNAPVEVIESTYPLFVNHYGLVTDSEGAGTYRGGMGIRREFTVLSEKTTVTLSSDRFRISPWGVLGGRDAALGQCILVSPEGKARKLPAKVTLSVEKGSKLVVITPGGGGWGDPLKRDVDKVRRDVVTGVVSRKDARETYGVYLKKNLEIDSERTEKSRADNLARDRSME